MPNFTAVRLSASEKAALRRSPSSGCSLWPPTSIFVIHSSPSRRCSRQTTDPSGRHSYSSCQPVTPSTSSSRSWITRASTYANARARLPLTTAGLNFTSRRSNGSDNARVSSSTLAGAASAATGAISVCCIVGSLTGSAGPSLFSGMTRPALVLDSVHKFTYGR